MKIESLAQDACAACGTSEKSSRCCVHIPNFPRHKIYLGYALRRPRLAHRAESSAEADSHIREQSSQLAFLGRIPK
jgi:hypothetical protein